MIGKPFINEVLSLAIEDYLKYKNRQTDAAFSSFPVMVIRTLIYIYGELDIINPYITHNEHNMGGFDNNLTKFGFPKEKVELFKNLFLQYQQELNEGKKPNTSFLQLEKYLIDMYFYKQRAMNLPLEKKEEFKQFIYLSGNSNPYIHETLEKFVWNLNELDMYFQSVCFEMEHNFSIEELRRSTLAPEAYMLLGYSMEQISLLNDIDLRKVNEQVFNFFLIDKDAPNKDELLLKAVSYYKKYGNRITSGNGFVDMLLVASVLITAIFIIGLVLM